VTAWREADVRYRRSRFPRVPYVIGRLSRFPADAEHTWREVQAAIRRQPNHARPLVALVRYEEALAVLAGRQEPVMMPPDDPSGVEAADLIDPVQLVFSTDARSLAPVQA
jgi:hypothetical protein